MNTFVKKLENFLLTNTVWFFLTAILLITTGWLIPDFSQKTWGEYFGYLFSMIVQFSPILLFAFFRNSLREKFSTLAYIGLWFLTFVGFLLLNHPFIYDTLGITAFGSVPMHDGFVPLIMCGLFLLTELILLSNDFFVNKTSSSSIFRKIDLDHLVLFILLVLAIASTLIPYFFGTENFKSLSILQLAWGFIQHLIISLGAYFFYFVNRRFLIPSLLKKKGIVYFGAGLFATMLLFYPLFGQLMISLPIMNDWYEMNLDSKAAFNGINLITADGSIIFLILLLSTPVIIAFDWFKQSSEIATLEKEKSETELNLLKQQINPHFFFNTLNNLYALSLTKDEQTPEVILQLSELMRYVIYKGKEQEVALKEEVKYIEDYIQLQQIRLAKNLDYKFEKDIDNLEMKVPPLLFINLVENAFKHGIEPAEGDCFLHLNLKSRDGNLSFVCKNSFEEREMTADGTGLKNLNRRLELRFPERHELTVDENGQTFTASLKITQ